MSPKQALCAALYVFMFAGGWMWASSDDQATASPSILSDRERMQEFFDENTYEVCAGGIVYFFGLHSNRSWFHPKIDVVTQHYVRCK